MASDLEVKKIEEVMETAAIVIAAAIVFAAAEGTTDIDTAIGTAMYTMAKVNGRV